MRGFFLAEVFKAKITCLRYLREMKFFSALFLIAWSSITVAETSWKLGIGLGNVMANSYPGSSQSENITSPIPYLNVKTDWFDFDREGLHTHWFEQTRFRLDFSFDLGLPSESKMGTVREGMADINPAIQIGPMISYRLLKATDSHWHLQLPLLFAGQLDDTAIDSIGYSIQPRIYFNQQIGKQRYPYDLALSFGLLYASSEYHAYYYDVSASDVTVTRAAFESGAGYGGYRFNLSLTKRFDDYWAGLYLRYHNISDAVFEQSSLVEQQDYWFIAVGISWLFAGNL